MFTRVRLLIVVVGLAPVFILGCGDSATQPVGPSATPSVTSTFKEDGVSAALAGGRMTPFANVGNARTITLFDACDPETFNAELGAGTCMRNGGVRFENFIEQLTRHHSVGAWHFAPPQARLDVGDVLVAENHGGETHTFTEVEEFGGGIVPLLNQLSG